MTGLLIDTYALMEIFSGSPWGHKALASIQKHSPQVISVLTLYELQYRLSSLYGKEKTDSLLAIIIANAEILPVDMQIAITAGSIKAEQKRTGSGMGAVDCMLLATARVHKLKILTGDRHFNGFDEVTEV